MSIDIKNMSDSDLLNIDPMELTSEQLTRWESAQKKAVRINKVYEYQLEQKVKQAELEARDFMAKRDIKMANLQNMQATISMEDLYDDYQKAIQKASNRINTMQSEALPKMTGHILDPEEKILSKSAKPTTVDDKVFEKENV